MSCNLFVLPYTFVLTAPHSVSWQRVAGDAPTNWYVLSFINLLYIPPSALLFTSVLWYSFQTTLSATYDILILLLTCLFVIDYGDQNCPSAGDNIVRLGLSSPQDVPWRGAGLGLGLGLTPLLRGLSQPLLLC